MNAVPGPVSLRAALALLALLLAASLGSVAVAAPVRTVLAARGEDGAWPVLSALAELWRSRYEPTPERLLLREMPDPARRLHTLSRGRGDLAVVDVGTATARMAEHPRLTTLAVLWPNLLHAVSRNARVEELRMPLPAETWAFGSAGFARRVLLELGAGAPGQSGRVYEVPDAVLPDALAFAQEPLLLFAAPAPLPLLIAAQRAAPGLNVLPIASALVEELRLAHPWLVTEKLARGTYPGQERNLELPGVYQVLIGRRELPEPTVRKVLDTVYGRAAAMAPFEPLFGRMDGRMNAVFGKLLPFHPVTARRFGFTPAVP